MPRTCRWGTFFVGLLCCDSGESPTGGPLISASPDHSETRPVTEPPVGVSTTLDPEMATPWVFERSDLYRWPGEHTVVWYVDGGPLNGEPTLLLSESRFDVTNDGLVPKAASLEVLTPHKEGWKSETLTDPQGAVFHKAVLHDNGILTISGGAPGTGQPGLLKHWRRGQQGWQSKAIWSGSWGGKLNRLRDMELGDVDGDGLEEVVIGTHDQGVVVVLDGAFDGTQRGVVELHQAARRYVHEIELGDVDGDGRLEIVASISEPNVSEGNQAGTVEIFDYDGEKYVQKTIWSSSETHVKEILATDIDDNGTTELIVAVEAQREERKRISAVNVLMWEGASWDAPAWRTLAELDDVGLRFMQSHDLNKDGRKELFLAPRGLGLMLMSNVLSQSPKIQHFESESGGFEHAIQVLDLEQDGQAALFVANEQTKQLVRYDW